MIPIQLQAPESENGSQFEPADLESAMREGYATIDIVPEDLRAYL